MKKLIPTTSCLLLSIFSLLTAQISPFIHLDQFGYLPEANKVAILSDPQIGYNSAESYSPSSQLELRDAASDAVVMMINISSWNNGATHDQSGDKGWWVDFSSFQSPGTYYLIDVANEERSPEFSIGESVYLPVLKAATRMFYYNRCNMAKESPYAEVGWTDANSFMHGLQDANCRYIYDSTNVSLEKDLSGGWFDAGDYNKYVTFAHSAVHNLLWAYSENPDIFRDDWNIPESGNGVPDLLDEVKWELDWLLKMSNTDGTVHIKMGSKDYSDNTQAPPSANINQRFYGPTCTAASIATASMLSHAAEVFAEFPVYSTAAQQWETQAIACWNYVKPLIDANQLETACDDGSIISGDADWEVDAQKEHAVTAAIHLFSLTGDASYNNYVIAHATSDTEPLNGNDFWGPYKIPLTDALLHYTTIPGADNTLSNNILTSITAASSNNWNGFFGFNSDDLYRAYMPDWSYHWGSNQAKAGYGVLNQLLIKYDINLSEHADYDSKTIEMVHYFHGVNPLGMVQLSNMYDLGGDRCVNEIYHTWFADGSDWDHALTSPYGPPPGFVTGGANANFSVTSLSPPSGQPRQKSYLDFNTNWPDNSWEISEPAIYYQAMYVRLLANYAALDSSNSTAIKEGTLTGKQISVFPNPSHDIIRVRGEFTDSRIELWSLESLMMSLDNQSQELELDVRMLPAGVYFLNIIESGGQGRFVQKVVKE